MTSNLDCMQIFNHKLIIMFKSCIVSFFLQMVPEYKTNLMKLKNFVMVMFGKDTMVDPKETEV